MCRAVLADPSPRRVPGDVRVVAAQEYAGVWRQAVIAVKERSARSLVKPLGEALAVAVAELVAGTTHVGGPLQLVPMPSAPSAVRARGLDSTLMITRRVAAVLTEERWVVTVAPRLRHVRRVRDQSGLSGNQRRANLAGALSASRLAGPTVVIDDLVTTGASVQEAVRALSAGGANMIGAATLCAVGTANRAG